MASVFGGFVIMIFRTVTMNPDTRIAKKLREVAENPKRHVSSLRSIGAFKIRVGDYRLIADIDWTEEVVYVLTLGHRSTIYRH
jgi:mRNA-degrading endonuclease RelE of RelBE toxin-antitoxin system